MSILWSRSYNSLVKCHEMGAKIWPWYTQNCIITRFVIEGQQCMFINENVQPPKLETIHWSRKWTKHEPVQFCTLFRLDCGSEYRTNTWPRDPSNHGRLKVWPTHCWKPSKATGITFLTNIWLVQFIFYIVNSLNFHKHLSRRDNASSKYKPNMINIELCVIRVLSSMHLQTLNLCVYCVYQSINKISVNLTYFYYYDITFSKKREKKSFWNVHLRPRELSMKTIQPSHGSL